MYPGMRRRTVGAIPTQEAYPMRIRIFIAALLAGALLPAALTRPASAAAPDHELFTFPIAYTDTDLCGFPITVHGSFTNLIIDTSLLTGDGTLQLHQHDVETWTAKGVTLRVDDHYTIFVDSVGGVPQTAKHVGVLDDITGPDGNHLFFRTGEAVYQVVFDPNAGYYIDGPLVVRHGVRDNFDTAKICAAFG
jgi:hypothetical protein